jgi:two-component system response regulator NreC
MSNIRVVLAEDHTIVRKGLRSLLDAETDIEVVGEAGDGRQAVQQVGELHPDIVLMDITMPGLNGLEATRQIKQRYPEVQVLVLTMHATEEYIRQILRAGASGYLVKQAAVSELVLAIRAVQAGGCFLSPSISKAIVDEYSRQVDATLGEARYDRLTNREREVLQLVAEGHSSREIGETLCISVKTVEAHRASLMEKLDLHNVAEVTRYAIARGLIGVD